MDLRNKVVRAARIDAAVDEILTEQAKANGDTTSAHIRKVLTAHVKKQEVKPEGKREYGND